MCERNLQRPQLDLLRPLRAPPVKKDERLAPAIRQHLNVPPANAADSRAECLHHRLFRREARGEFGDSPTAVGNFVWGIDAIEEAIAVPGDNVGNAVNFDDVDSVGELSRHEQGSYATTHVRAAPAARDTEPVAD